MLTCGTGGGHNSACAAVAQAMAARGHAVTTLNPYTLKNDQVAEVIDKAYILLAQKAPSAFGAAYKLGDVYRKLPFPSPVYQLNRQMEPVLERYMGERRFDAVVTTHLFPAEILTSMKRSGASVPRTYFIATDYACIPFTEETDLDRYIIPAKELTEEFVGRGIDPERIRPLGIPVRPPFYQREDRAAVRARLGLPAEKKIILAAGGSIGAGHIQQVVGILLDRYGPGADIIVVCGSNRELKEHVGRAFGGRCTVLGFTDRMADYMKACDLYLSKPGGLSSTEAAVVGTALVHITPIPGCETSNMHFFAQKGMSLAVNSPEHELIDACDRLLAEGAREKMIECQHRVIPADAAGAICELLEGEYRAAHLPDGIAGRQNHRSYNGGKDNGNTSESQDEAEAGQGSAQDAGSGQPA